MIARLDRWIGLALAHVLLCGCITRVELAPRSFEWSWGLSEAVWRAEGFEVQADLHAEDLEYPMRGIVRAEHPGASITFESPDVVRTEAFGRICIGAEVQPITAGTWYPIPEGAKAGLVFDLRPDVPWPDPPAVDSAVSYSLVLRDGTRTETCRFRFRVDSTRNVASPGARAAIVVVLVLVIIGLVLLAGLANAHDNWKVTEWHTPELRMPLDHHH